MSVLLRKLTLSRETRDATGRFSGAQQVKGDRSEFISTLDGEHR
jgi:hypothetical protein